jgi:pimeloyl-ACP methyl ester carboxylesterase
MDKVISADGTEIAYESVGSGPTVVLVGGAFCDHTVTAELADALAGDFTAVSYDRRGRGESGDTPPYAVAREVEDIAALLDAAGGSAALYGISSGGALALAAAEALPDRVSKLALYEIPFVVDDSRPPAPDDLGARLAQLIATDRRGDAVKLFMREAVRLPPILVAAMPLFPGWGKNKAIAHTLPYDVAIMDGGQRGTPLPADRWTSVTMPTLVASGSKSPAWVRHAAAQLAEVLPRAQHRTLEGQRHYVKADALGPVLEEFLTP